MSGKVVSDDHERTCKGPWKGGRDTTTSSWQYADLSAAVNEYVEINAESKKLYVCFVASTSTSPSTTDTSNSFATANVARLMAEGESLQRVVDEDRPYLAYMRGEASDGSITIFRTGV